MEELLPKKKKTKVFSFFYVIMVLREGDFMTLFRNNAYLRKNSFNLLFFIIFLLSLIAYLIFPFRPWGTLKGVEESFFIFSIVGGLTLVISLIVYCGMKGGYFMRMGDEAAVHLLTEADRKKPFRRAVTILEIGALIVLAYEIISIIYLTRFGYDRSICFSHITVYNEIISRIIRICISLVISLALYIVFLIYRKQEAYWNIYIAHAVVFNSEEEIMEALRAETHRMSIKYMIKQFIRIMKFDNRKVREWLLTQEQKEFNEEDEFILRQKEIERIRTEYNRKQEEQMASERAKWDE